jgi:uncharacterized membrane protein
MTFFREFSREGGLRELAIWLVAFGFGVQMTSFALAVKPGIYIGLSILIVGAIAHHFDKKYKRAAELAQLRAEREDSSR